MSSLGMRGGIDNEVGSSSTTIEENFVAALASSEESRGVGGGGNAVGLALAVSSSAFIGASFIIKKKGLRRAASTGLRAGSGGHGYLMEPLWWAGTLTMAGGEAANFAAYAFAPAVLVTPLGALSILVSAVLANFFLNEYLHVLGWVGCLLCVVGSVDIVMNAPEEREVTSIHDIAERAMTPEFGFYVFTSLITVAMLMILGQRHGSSNLFIYIGICSLMGSLSVMSCKALGIAIKLTFEGENQMMFVETHASIAIVVICVVTQINYLNKALDTFNTAVVSPIYYVFFTTFTLLASTIMYKDYIDQTTVQTAMVICGFLTILCGTFLLHYTKDYDGHTYSSPSSRPQLLPRDSLSAL